MASENRRRCGCEDPPPITKPSSRRRRRRCSLPFDGSNIFIILVIAAAAIGASSAFISPQSHAPPSALAPGPYVNMMSPDLTARTGGVLSRTRIIREIRYAYTSRSTTSMFVTLSESDELTDLKLQSNNATLPDNIPTDYPMEVTSESPLEPAEVEVMIPMEEIDEQHMERVRMGDDVEELTHLLAHDQVDLQILVSPSIPISYDENGTVQADATTLAPAISTNEIIAIDANGAMALSSDTEPDYPAFIKFLFQKDTNGQTIASKVFNFALLAASFGYVFISVFNIDRGMTRGWSPVEISMRIPLDTWASYENSLSEKPVATKTIINIVIYLLGDWLSQTLFNGKNVLDFDAARTLKNGFVGMCFGPAVHEYYEFSDWILPVDGATMGITNRAFKILMDQTVYLSIKCSIYILAIGVLNGDSLESSSENVKNRIKPIMYTAWKFWPLVHCVTYGLIPARHRILWVNSVDLVWNAILASKARDDGDEEGEDLEVGRLGGSEKEMSVLEANGDGGSDLLQRIGSMLPTPDPSSDDDNDVAGLSKEPIISDEDEEDLSDGNILGAQWEKESSVSEELR